MKKSKIGTVLIILATLILAGVAIFTAIRLYQLRQVAVAPTAPTSKPKAAGETCGGIAGTSCPSGEVCIYADGTTSAPFPDASGVCQTSIVGGTCSLSFSLSAATATATATATSTSGATATATSTSSAAATATATSTASGAPNSCGGTCGSNANCQGSFICYQGFCRNPECVAETDCSCSVGGVPASTPPPSQPELPDSGTSWPTIMGMGIGVLVILGSLLLSL